MFLTKEERKELKEFKLQLLQEKKEKEMLLSSKTDWALLEKLIKSVNTDKNLRVEVRLNDGTKFFIASYEPKKMKDFQMINGDYIVSQG